jgi:hypothetical protein
MNATNSTTLRREWKEFMTRSTATIAIETSTLILIGLIAVGGNLLVVISIYRNPSLRTITNYFVLSLSLTDILYPLMGLPVTIISSVLSRFIFAQEMCDFQALSVISLTFISVITMGFMAVNRFIRVCKPQKYNKLFNRKTSLVFISIVWMTSFAGVAMYNKIANSLPYAMFVPDELRCNFVYDMKNTVFVVLGNLMIFICFVLSFTIIIYCYFKVFKKIRQHKRNIAPSSNPSGLGTSVQEIKVTWTLFAVLLGYCVTWIPVLIVTLLSNVFGWSFLPRQVHMIVTFAGSSSSAVNPIIYGLMNTAFRQEYAKIFGCK